MALGHVTTGTQWSYDVTGLVCSGTGSQLANRSDGWSLKRVVGLVSFTWERMYKNMTMKQSHVPLLTPAGQYACHPQPPTGSWKQPRAS